MIQNDGKKPFNEIFTGYLTSAGEVWVCAVFFFESEFDFFYAVRLCIHLF